MANTLFRASQALLFTETVSKETEPDLNTILHSSQYSQAAKLQHRLAALEAEYAQRKPTSTKHIVDGYFIDELIAGQNRRSKRLNAVIARSFTELSAHIRSHEAAALDMRAICALPPSLHHIAALYKPSKAGSGPRLFVFETMSPTHVDDSRDVLIRLCIHLAQDFPALPVYLHFLDTQRGLGCMPYTLTLLNKLLAYNSHFEALSWNRSASSLTVTYSPNRQNMSHAMDTILHSVPSALVTITDDKTFPAEFYKHVQSEGALSLIDPTLRRTKFGRRGLTIDDHFNRNAAVVQSKKGVSTVSFSLDRKRIKAYQLALETCQTRQRNIRPFVGMLLILILVLLHLR